MSKTVNSNYGSVGAPGSTFDSRISADTDAFDRNDVDALGNALDNHDHTSGKGLAVQRLTAGQVAGDVFYATGAGAIARLPIGTANQVLHGGASAPAYSGVAPADMLASAWSTFVPTMGQNGAVTITVTHASYIVLGKIAIVNINVTITSAGSAGNAIVLSSIPAAIAPRYTGNSECIGTFFYAHTGVQDYTGVVLPTNASNFEFLTTLNTNVLGASPSFAAANTDTLSLFCVYEIA